MSVRPQQSLETFYSVIITDLSPSVFVNTPRLSRKKDLSTKNALYSIFIRRTQSVVVLSALRVSYVIITKVNQ